MDEELSGFYSELAALKASAEAVRERYAKGSENWRASEDGQKAKEKIDALNQALQKLQGMLDSNL